MNNSNWVKIVAIISLVLALTAVIGTVLIYIKINNFGFIPAKENLPPLTGQVKGNSENEAVKIAFGFLGFPISKLIKEGETLKFTMKGHWIFDENAKFDYINKTDNIQTEIKLDKNTKIKVFESQVVKNGVGITKEKEILLTDFTIDSFDKPFLVVFSSSVVSDSKTALAKEIKIYPKLP